MANTYTSLHYHIIFSTKNREPWLVTDIEQRDLNRERTRELFEQLASVSSFDPRRRR